MDGNTRGPIAPRGCAPRTRTQFWVLVSAYNDLINAIPIIKPSDDPIPLPGVTAFGHKMKEF